MKIKPHVASFIVLISLLSFGDRCLAETGDLKITFKFVGEIPPPKLHNAAVFGNVQNRDETLIVNKENKGIRNIVMYLYNHKRGTLLPAQPVPKHTLLLDIKNYRFEPRVLLAQAGDKLAIRNSDPIGQNAHVHGFANHANVQIPAKKTTIFALTGVEPTVIRISSNIHPWMRTNALIVNHSFYGKSNEDGVLEIEDIPVGKKVVFKVWHETGNFKEDIIVDGKEEEWKKNTVEFEIKAGMNDVGVVEIPASNFQRDRFARSRLDPSPANRLATVYHACMYLLNQLSIVIATLLTTSVCLIAQEAKTESTARTGELRMTFKFKGDVPKPRPLELPAICGNLEMLDETLIVNGNSKGIMNVVVYAHRGKDKASLPTFAMRSKKRNLACWNCRFVPRVTLAQVGDQIRIQNMDEIGYSTDFSFFTNDAVNIALAPGNTKTIGLERTEPGMIPVAASVFPWMVGYVLVVDHPYYAISNPDGIVTIRDLPVGKKMVFRAWHERGSFKERIYVDGKETKWNANKFEVQIKPGMNDLGDIEIPGSEFDVGLGFE